MSPCDSAACLAALGAGEWRANGTWRWHARACCGFGHVGAARARELLRGRRLLFVGDSTARRHMWAVIDAVGGRRRVRRRRGGAVPDSRAAFDEAAIRLNDTIFDSQRAYHGGQVVLLNVDDGAWTLLDPLQLCGVPRKNWTVDGRYVAATQRGEPPPWGRMRGAQLRLLVSPPADANASARRTLSRASLQRLAADALRGERCNLARSIKECSYQEALKTKCADVKVRPADSAFAIELGDRGGHCQRGALLVEKALRAALAGSGARVERAHRCADFCRPTFRLECRGATGASTAGFDAAVRAALAEHARTVPARSAAVLVFAYGAELAEWEDALDHWSAASFGYGADLTLLGATWANVMQTRKGSGALHWETEKQEARWRRVLGGCAAAGRCALRTVTEHLRQTAEAPYADFERHVRPLAAEAGVALLSQFAATWSGARLGVLRHHDTTRIHFSDAGRRFLAQLTLNALPVLLPPRAPLPPVGTSGSLSLR